MGPECVVQRLPCGLAQIAFLKLEIALLAELEVAKEVKGELRQLFEAARWSPSCSNEQPWRFITGIRGEGESYKKIFDLLDPGNQKWAGSAPVLLLLATKTIFTRNDKDNKWADYDAGQAAAHLTFQAMEMGIFVHQMAGFDREKALQLFGQQEELRPMTVIAAGYIDHDSTNPDELKRRERSEVKRRQLNEFVLSWD